MFCNAIRLNVYTFENMKDAYTYIYFDTPTAWDFGDGVHMQSE